MLYLVPTPIGNLEDITIRAVRVLKEVDVIACEDTRTTRVLLKHYEITTPCVSYHDHNERTRASELVNRMKSGTQIALVSDAGSPGISDPGFYLVRACIREGVPVTALPGASAVIPALTVSGLPSERFCFEGFLPAKKGRRTKLDRLSGEERTIVLYESPHRIGRTLKDLCDVLGPTREAAVVRELSKKFEEVVRGPLASLAEKYSEARVRGEIVVIVGPA
jgi:16S rRNA (cytidine1402-2'-O)-methyltransferase